MYLHLGESTIVKKKDIVGIFDLDTTTVMKSSRNYINKAEKEIPNVYKKAMKSKGIPIE